MCKKKGFMGDLNNQFTTFLFCVFITASFGALQVDPAEHFVSTGPEGGPFEPAQKTYILTNTGQSSLYWGAETDASWLQCSPEWGLLAAGNSVEVSVLINATAESLTVGEHQENIVFTDISGGLNYTRLAILTVTSTISGPVAWWKLDGDATDSSGNNHHGTINGNPDWMAEGIVNGAVRLQPEQDYFSINGYKGILGGNSRTTCAWIKIAENVTGTTVILSWGTSELGKLWSFRANTYWDDPLESKIEIGVWGGVIRGSTRLNDDQWHHVAAVLQDDGSANLSEVRLFVDGIQESTILYNYQGSIPNVVTTEGQEVFMGKQLLPDLDPFWFNGSMDDVRIYNRALSQTEILILVNNGLLQVTPRDSFDVSGEPGGPFSPAYKDYTIKNLSDQVLYWGIDPLPDWVDTDVSFGSVNPNESTVVRVFLTEAADALEEGSYLSALTIYNLSTAQDPVIRNINLDVQYIHGIWIDPNAFDVTLVEGNQQQQILTIGNDGTQTLNFSVRSRTVSEPAAAAFRQTETGLSAASAVQQKKMFDIKKALKKEHKPHQVLVRFAPDPGKKHPAREKQQQMLSQVLPASSIVKQFASLPGLSLVQLPSDITVQQALSELNARKDVLYVQPNYRVYADSVPNDSRFGELWGLHNSGQSGGTADADIDAPEAWDSSTGSNSVVVAVIDTGVDYNHEDLADNMWNNLAEKNGTPGVDDDQNGFIDDIYGYDFCNNDANPMDDHYHGTHCAGTIAAVGNNGKGVTGVCWNVKIMPIKFLDSGGGGWTDDAIDSVEYATLMHAKVMSNSWGGGSYSQALKDAIDAAGQAGIAFVAAAGNDGVNNDTYPHYPSSYTSDNVISVLATDRYDNRSSFSNYGLVSVDLGAPGSSILSCQPGNRYQFLNGTSMATPHVSGACALLWSLNPLLTVTEVKDILLDTVDPLTVLAGKCVSGGRLNLSKAVLETSAPWISFDVEQGQIEPGQSISVQVTFNAAALTPGQYTAEILVISDDTAHPQLIIPVTLTVLPDPLEISPESSFDPDGIEGGPFMPASQTYTLLNTGQIPLEWSAQWQAGWLDVEPASGILNMNETVNVTVSVNEQANLLQPDLYQETLLFNNLTVGGVQPRNINLSVRPTDKFTQVFAADFDLAYHSVMLRPDSAKSYYVSCIESELIQGFYSDPNGGIYLPLADDDFVEVLLADGKQVMLYGTPYERVYIGSNGYLTFGQGDVEHEAAMENHFELPRIAPLFSDLTPANGQSISYQQTEDRLAVTYSQVPVFGNKTSCNTFQVELFFADGAIRMSYLNIDAASAIVGLSEGLGQPGLFEESDFSSYLKCCNCGDLDGDSQVELSDLCEFAAAWLQTPCAGPEWCSRTDFDRSGAIDFADLSAISENWQHADYAWSEPDFLLELNGKTWTHPVPLAELNDSSGNKGGAPCLTRDGLNIFFVRHIPSLGHPCVIQASRSVSSGPFANERVLTEIDVNLLTVGSPWISDDSKRLYYHEAVNLNPKEIILKMAEWSEVLDRWVPGIKVFEELHYGPAYFEVEPSLTADELTIIWQANRPDGAGSWDLWTASRPSTDQAFSNIHSLSELNTSDVEGSPCISPDGLTLYFVSATRTPGDQTMGIYKATRDSLTGLFENVELVEFPDSNVYWEQSVYMDVQQEIVYFQNADTGGVYMTSFEPHPLSYPANETCFSDDQLNAYFSRYIPELSINCIVEAQRATAGGPFTSERVYPQLNVTSGGAGSTWISHDRLRLYFHELGIIKMSQRSTVDDAFTEITRTFLELQGLGDGRTAAPALTDDELIIVFHSPQSGSQSGAPVALWIAGRSSVDEPFSNKRPLDEINSSKYHYSPWLSADGKTIYFSSNRDDDAGFDIFMAQRNSVEEFFGPVTKVTDGVGNQTTAPYMSPDGKNLYYYDETAQYKGTWLIKYEQQLAPCLPR